MILQALAEYYDRKSSDPNVGLATMGFEAKEIPFVIEVSQKGNFIQLEDTREVVGKKKLARSFIVPQSTKRSGSKSFEKPNLLWDHYGFVLGYAKREGKDAKPSSKDILAANLQHQYFIKLVEKIYEETNDNQVKSVLGFLHNGDYTKLFASPQWGECANIKGCNLAFRIQGERDLVCNSPNVIRCVESRLIDEEGNNKNVGVCLVTGNKEPIERLHPSITGIGKKPTPLAAINDGSLPSLSSFGKHQGFNFPVGQKATFAYTTALNFLLRKGSPQRMLVGDACTVFWAAKESKMETVAVSIFDQPEKDNPDRVLAIQELFKSIQHGHYAGDDKDTRFYVLGLAPNVARISVRFWHVGTVAEMAEKIVQHFSDLEIVHGPNEVPFLSLFRLLVSTASLGKSENILPNLAGDTMRAILEGLPYPQTLLGAAIRRIKAEQSKKAKNTNKLLPNVTYSRAAIIKAYINRTARYTDPENKEELKVSLDKLNTNIGYRLGRLFAVLEKVQEEANPGLNATIRDRYYGSASSSPVTAFSTLLKLSKHHIAKLNKGREINIERLIGDIMAEIQDFPAHLAIANQGRFAIGYYHQRQAFFTKSETKEINDE